MKIQTSGVDIEIIMGDITVQEVDAVVNAANKGLTPGGGVSGAIHRAAGPDLYNECKSLNGCETGQAKLTKGCNLTAKYVIHTVGPVYSGTNEDAKLLSLSYKESLILADNNNLESIAFPSISTGIFGYPIEEASKIALNTVIETSKLLKNIKLIRFVLYDLNSFEVFKSSMHKIQIEEGEK